MAVAPDFTFLLADGQTSRLYQTACDRLTLLMFYDPECDDCHYMMFRLSHSSVVAEAIRENRLQILAVYADGNRNLWEATNGELPSAWMAAMDMSSVKERELYDLSGLPMLYLLDKDKRIVMLDPDFYELTRFLNHQR